MVIFLHGADTFRSREYLKEQITKFKVARDPQGYNVVVVDGQKEKAGRILSEMVAMPFLAERRMIVITNILSSSDKELLQELIDRVKTERIPESNVVIFWQGEALSKVKEVKEFQALLIKQKYTQEFASLTGIKLSAWAKKELEDHGGSIEPSALEYLCQNAGHDLWFLNSLLQQLSAFKRRATIGMADVELFLEEKVDDNAFNMVDAIVSGNHKLAFKLLEEQRRQGEEESRLFGLLVWQFRIILELADALEREGSVSSDVLAKKIGIHPFVAKKNIGIAKRYPIRKIEEMYERLLNIDIKTKTGQADQGLLIDLFVGTI